MMDLNAYKTWVNSRQPKTRAFIKLSSVGVLAAMCLASVQSTAWYIAGFGSVNFLPLWAVVAVWLIGAAFALPVFYISLAGNWFQTGKMNWPKAALTAVVGGVCVAAAIGGSLPQLSTLIVSEPMTMTLAYRYNEGGRACRGTMTFGPLLRFHFPMCTGLSASPARGERIVSGYGNGLAMRITRLGEYERRLPR